MITITIAVFTIAAIVCLLTAMWHREEAQNQRQRADQLNDVCIDAQITNQELSGRLDRQTNTITGNTDVIALLRMQLAGADQANASLHRQVNEMETVRAGATDWSEIADGVNRQLADSIASGSRMAQVLRDVHNQTSPASLQQIVTSNDTNLEGVPP